MWAQRELEHWSFWRYKWRYLSLQIFIEEMPRRGDSFEYNLAALHWNLACPMPSYHSINLLSNRSWRTLSDDAKNYTLIVNAAFKKSPKTLTFYFSAADWLDGGRFHSIQLWLLVTCWNLDDVNIVMLLLLWMWISSMRKWGHLTSILLILLVV